MAAHRQFLIGLCLLLGYMTSECASNTIVQDAVQELFHRYSSSKTLTSDVPGLTSEDFGHLLEGVTLHSREYIHKVAGACPEGYNCTWKYECPGIDEIFQTLGTNGHLSQNELMNALPVALNTLISTNCTEGAEELSYHGRKKRKPTMGEAWGYGLGFATVVAIISNIGIFLGPFMEKKFFKRLLQFLVAMGAGSLASTGLMVLIPEAFDVISIEELDGYLWKSTVAIFTVYVLFTSERMLKTFLYNKKKRKFNQSISISISRDDSEKTPGSPALEPLTDSKDGHGHSHFPAGNDEADRKTLAWMVMAGDVIHNFVDGLSIGAGFTEDISLGISISLAVVCEELPHELADIAILLHSGLSIKRALFINFLSACTCYLGLVLGILLGSMVTEASKWIFAMAGGLFLYVPLVDMLPDMSAHLDILLSVGSREARIVAFLHACGLVLGTIIIVVIVNINAYIVV